MVCTRLRAKLRNRTQRRFEGDRPRQNKQTRKYLVDIFQGWLLSRMFCAECNTEHCPCRKTTCFAPHSALSQWHMHMSTNGPNCKKPTWKNTFPTPRFLTTLGWKRLMSLSQHQYYKPADELARALPSFNRPLLSLDVTVSKASNEIPSNRSTFMHPIRAIFFFMLTSWKVRNFCRSAVESNASSPSVLSRMSWFILTQCYTIVCT